MYPLSFGRRNKGLLLKTGQTTQYAGLLDNGYYQKGIAKSYTVLTSGQYSGTTNITLNAKTDSHSNNCVFDNNTGLMWSRYVSATLGPNNNGTLPWTTNGDGEGIFAFCAAANAASLGGHSDWRVPNLFEIMSLLNYEGGGCYPNSTAFPSFYGGWIHTSTTKPPSTTYALVSSSYSGQVDAALKTANYVVLLVRGG